MYKCKFLEISNVVLTFIVWCLEMLLTRSNKKLFDKIRENGAYELKHYLFAQ